MKARRAAHPPIRRVVVVAKKQASEGLRIADEMAAWFRKRSVRVRFDARTAKALGLKDGVPEGSLPADTDLAVVAGGDGTFLSVARAAVPRGIPILGVNFGGLGFMTELQPEETYAGLEKVLAGDYAVEERTVLRVRPKRGGRRAQEYAILNDAVLAKSASPRMLSLELRIDDDLVAKIHADGLIVSTATGSTAYNLSAGGPIVDPRMRAFVVTPICPHTLSYRPLVVPGHVSIEVVLRSTPEAAMLTLDGQVALGMKLHDEIRIDAHPKPAKLVRVAHRGFFEVLHRKLGWGER
ncbi:MAG TPA: NAD(+)/NADH kinase [Candidatus Polarisedimenticolaceae bacterium]